MALFNERYRIEPARLRGRDYSAPGHYFVTICTRNRRRFFGNVVNGVMHRSAIGEIVAEEWRRTATVRRNVQLDEWIVMPDHLHGIIRIVGPVPSEEPCPPDAAQRPRRPAARFSPNSLGSMIGQFKSVCTKRIREAGYDDFEWQARFFDHIIRDNDSLISKRTYILENPFRWESEKCYPENLDM